MIIKLLIDRNRAEKERNARIYPRISNPEAISSLTVLPLIDFKTASPEARTEPGVSYLVTAGNYKVLMDVGFNAKHEHPSPLIFLLSLSIHRCRLNLRP